MVYLYPLRYHCGLGGLPSFCTANPSASWYRAVGSVGFYLTPVIFACSMLSLPFLNLLYGVVSLYVVGVLSELVL
jgi:hypothetical protein